MTWLTTISLWLVLLLIPDLGLPTNAKKRQHHGEESINSNGRTSSSSSSGVALNITAVTGISVDLRLSLIHI